VFTRRALDAMDVRLAMLTLIAVWGFPKSQAGMLGTSAFPLSPVQVLWRMGRNRRIHGCVRRRAGGQAADFAVNPGIAQGHRAGVRVSEIFE
jgi:hypothetical protein